jgi:hypothetical protein
MYVPDLGKIYEVFISANDFLLIAGTRRTLDVEKVPCLIFNTAFD